MRTNRGYRALDNPVYVGPRDGECTACLVPVPCHHVVVVDTFDQEWILTAAQAANLDARRWTVDDTGPFRVFRPSGIELPEDQ